VDANGINGRGGSELNDPSVPDDSFTLHVHQKNSCRTRVAMTEMPLAHANDEGPSPIKPPNNTQYNTSIDHVNTRKKETKKIDWILMENSLAEFCLFSFLYSM
jgi:hypothetical protein